MTINKMKLPEITLDWLREKDACSGGYKYCAEVKITEPIALIQRLIDDDHNDWANWLIVRIMTYRQRITYSVHAAEFVLPIFEKEYPDDLRPRKAIEAVRKCLTCVNDENKIIFAAAYYAANKCEKEAYAKILAYGIELLVKDKQ